MGELVGGGRRGFPASPFFEKLNGEALALLAEARDYLAAEAAADVTGLAAHQAAVYARAIGALTAKLTRIVAWLLVRRALDAGEIGEDDPLLGECSFAGLVHAMKMPYAVMLPERAADLAERGDGLFRRVARLDAMLNGRVEPAPANA
ncbi:MAG: DUF1465 family protein [Alphaproteobacteria bacterium]|nr:DUF1465 family protein [Alphaproteobacteria bacterium]